MGLKFTVSDLIIWSGIALGILDWLTDMLYCSNVQFAKGSVRSACVTFIVF